MQNNERIDPLPEYFDLWKLIQQLAEKTNVPISITGSYKPEFKLGELHLKVENLGSTEGTTFENNYLHNILFAHNNLQGDTFGLIDPNWEKTHNSDHWSSSYTQQATLSLKNIEPMSTYGIITLLDSENQMTYAQRYPNEIQGENISLLMQVIKPTKEGKLNFESASNETIAFVSRLEPNSVAGSSILVELSAGEAYWYKIISPEDLTLE